MSDGKGMLLEEIIRKKMFHHVYQPIYALENWKVFGHEALLRCRFFPNPEGLFQLAMDKNKLYELDICSVQHALSSVNLQYARLFVNVYPSTLIHPSFPDFLQNIRSAVCPIVFEINEAEKVPDMGALKKAVSLIREMGYAIALDDFGKAGSSFCKVTELEPEFVKLDRYFAQDLSVSAKKQKAIQRLLDICRDKKMKMILEGIEKPADLAFAKALGVHLGQGYLLGEPFPLSEIHAARG